MPGSYALYLRCDRSAEVSVGALGRFRVEPGAYLYIGSAFGPGGLRARLSRHAARSKIKRWHIDYIRPRMSLAGAWISTSSIRLEHDWAAKVLGLSLASVPLPGFGSSDCGCASHLVHFRDLAAGAACVSDALEVTRSHEVGHVTAGRLRGLSHMAS
jgi:Uri superfamily endonuclease